MSVFDEGSGPPLIVIPGVQGRWEWMRPALRALATTCRTISYSLRPTQQDGEAGFAELLAQLEAVMQERGITAAAICGVSFGGFVAVKFAAARPARTRALILVSTPSPSWSPSETQAGYLKRPWLSTPAFVARAPGRMWPEIRAAIDGTGARLAFSMEHAARIIAAPIVPAHMAQRIKLRNGVDFEAACAAVTAPALVITGEPALDFVVPVQSTREYVDLIHNARYEMMDRTGHIGLVTQPERFARIAGGFVNATNT
jgi:pimeloyl-ACP methyl ester carboxylesterase